MIKTVNRCLIDNRTLELAGFLIEEGVRSPSERRLSAYIRALEDTVISKNDSAQPVMTSWVDFDDQLAAVANLLSAILIFDDLSFARTGFEGTWQRLPCFSRKIGKVVVGRDVPESLSMYERRQVRGGVDPRADFYLALSSSLKCDLIVSPRRSMKLQERRATGAPSYGSYAADLLATMDRQLAERIKKSESDLLITKLVPNLTFPSLATLVLSTVTHRSEILDAAIDLRNSRELKDLRRVIGECMTDLKSGVPYARLVDRIPDAIRLAFRDVGRLDPDQGSISMGFSLFFFSIGKEIGGFVPPYLLFLRDLVACRLEFAGFASHINRLFGENN